MKKRQLLMNRMLWVLCCCFWVKASIALSQSTYIYPLINTLEGHPIDSAPSLIPIPNNTGLTGTFSSQNVPLSTCSSAGIAPGYFFEDDAGLQFNNPPTFISCAYTVKFNFKIDEMLFSPPWVRILSFTHTNDRGIFIRRTGFLSISGTLEFWPFGLTGPFNFFNTTDFYQMVLVRDCSGNIDIYVNCNLFASFDDSATNTFVPQAPNNYIVFFRDHPAVLANEASPGFVSDISISNYAWSAVEIADACASFCPVLLPIAVIDFQAKVLNRDVKLNWSISQQIDPVRIALECRLDNEGFKEIYVTQNGECEKQLCSFSYRDQPPGSGMIYYRLRLEDIDGNISYSQVVEVNIEQIEWQVFPNPAKDEIVIRAPQAKVTQGYSIRKLTGQLVQQGIINTAELKINIRDWPTGVYLVRILNEERRLVQKLVVSH